MDTIGVQGDAILQFTPTHKKVRVQLPDLQFVEVSLDFSKPVFHAVQELCAELGIRHPEELSLLKPYEGLKKEGRRSFRGKLKKRHSQSSLSSDDNLSANSDDKTRGSKDSLTPNYNSLPRHGYASPNGSVCTPSPGLSPGYSDGPYGTIETTSLASSPVSPSQEAIASLFKPKTLQEKAVVNKGYVNTVLLCVSRIPHYPYYKLKLEHFYSMLVSQYFQYKEKCCEITVTILPPKVSPPTRGQKS